MIKDIHNSIIQVLSKGPLPVSEIVLMLYHDYTPGAIHEAIYTLATESIVDFPSDNTPETNGSILEAARTLLEKAGFISKKQPWIELAPEPSEQELMSRLTPDHIPRMWQLTQRGKDHLQHLHETIDTSGGDDDQT